MLFQNEPFNSVSGENPLNGTASISGTDLELKDRVLDKNNIFGNSHNSIIIESDRKPKKGLVYLAKTFDEFRDAIVQSFRDSGIDLLELVRQGAAEFVTDTTILKENPVTGRFEVDISDDRPFPIASALGRKNPVRFGNQATQTEYGLILYDHDGNVFQVVSSLGTEGNKKPYQYWSVKGASDRVYLAPLTPAIKTAIATRYSLDPKDVSWEFVKAHPEIPIIITEGVKKALSLLQLGYVAIAVYGCNCLGAKELIPFLPGRDVTICFDEDTKEKTRTTVAIAISGGAKKLKAHGAKVSVAHWNPSLGKGIDDVLVNHGAGAIDEILTSCQTLAEQARAAGLAKWLKRRGFTPTLTINTKYLNITDIPLGAESGVFAIRSPMGTGKSTVLLKIINHIIDRCGDLGIIALGSRNNLLLQLCKALNLYHLHQHDAFGLLRDPSSRIALCFDSLHHYENLLDCFDGKILLMDEFVTVLQHALTSSTCAGRRSPLLDILDELIRRAGFVLLLDGNGCDWAVDYVMKIRGGESGAERILNQYKNATTQFEVISSFSDSGFVGKILELLPLYKQLGQSTAIATDSQKNAEKLDILLSEMGYRIFRIDSKTSSSKEVKAFIEAPDRNNYDVLIYSPSAESGVNIDLPGFAHVFGMFYGQVGSETQIQMLRRVRQVDRISVLCVPYKRVNHSLATSSSQFLEELQNRLRLDGTKGIEGYADWFAAQTKTPRFEAWRGLAIDREFEQSNTTLCLLEMAKIHGFKPNLVSLEDVKELGTKLTEINKEIALREAEGIYHARDLSLSEYLKLKSSFECGEGDRYALEKFKLKDSLPGVEHSEFWSAEGIYEIRKNWNKTKELTLLWDLQNSEKAKAIASNRWQRNVTENRFIGDCDRTPLAKVKYLQALKVLELEGQEFSEDHEIIQNIVKISKDKRRGIRSVLGLSMGGLAPIKWFSNILSKVGISLTSRQVKGQSRLYKFKEFSALEKAFYKWISDRRETQYQQVIEGYQRIGETDIKRQSPVTKDQGAEIPSIEPSPPLETPPDEPKLIPLVNPQIGQKVALVRDGVTVLGDLLSYQAEFCRVNFPDGNQIVSQFELQGVA